MNSNVWTTVLSGLLTALLDLAPYVVFLGVLYLNYKSAFPDGFSFQHTGAVFAYLGGFIVFIIGFAVLRISPTVRVGVPSETILVIAICVAAGLILGFAFLYVLRTMSAGNTLYWFVFFTNASIMLALVVYVFIQDVKDVVVFSTLGFTLGVIINQIGSAGPSSHGHYLE